MKFNVFGERIDNAFGERIDNHNQYGESIPVVCGNCGFWENGVCRRWKVKMRRGSEQDAELCSGWMNKFQYEKEVFENAKKN